MVSEPNVWAKIWYNEDKFYEDASRQTIETSTCMIQIFKFQRLKEGTKASKFQLFNYSIIRIYRIFFDF